MTLFAPFQQWPFFKGWPALVLLTLLAWLLAWLLLKLGFHFLHRLLRDWKLDPAFADPLYPGLRALLPAFTLLAFLPFYKASDSLLELFRHTLALFIIIGVTSLCLTAVTLSRLLILSRYDLQGTNKLEARKAHTQFLLGERLLKGLILLAGIAIALMTFERVRQVGMSLLASAGLAGVVLGLAAQKLLGLMLAGVQIAISQPIRIDDAIVIDKEFGWVEEITLTYVVLLLWDGRRLVVPTTSFIDHSFENWTRSNGSPYGLIYLYTDYTLPVAHFRKAVRRMVAKHPLWDRNECTVHVSDATAETMQIRIMLTAHDVSDMFALRLDMREQFIHWLQKHYPQCLPRTRVSISDSPLREKLSQGWP